MPNVSISIGGQSVIVPGVYYNDQVVPVVPSGQQPTGPLVFIAQGYGGVPFKATSYTDPNALVQAMRGAPSTDFVNFMFNPSTQLNGASFVTYINVAPNTQSTAVIQSSGTPSSGVIDLTSTNYGAPSNLLSYSITEGSSAGKAITVLDGFSGQAISGDNLGTPFELSYTGISSGVSYSITTNVSGAATTLTITSPVVGESITLDLTTQTFSTIAQIIQQLNGTGHYVAIGVSGNGSMPASVLDKASNISLAPPISGVTNQFAYVTAYLGEPVWWFNNALNSPVTAVIDPNAQLRTALNAGQAALYQLQDVNTVYLSGATNQVASLNNYATGFDAALNELAWVVFADSTNQGVRALGAQHALTASDVVHRSWRRFVTGSALNETASTAQSNARSLNEFEATYVWPGIQRTNTFTGLNQMYDGLHVGAAVAGMMVGNPVTTPLTAKTLIGNGIEQITDLATKIALQSNGVLVLDFTTQVKIPTLLSDVTCWQNDSTSANVFNQQISCRWALAYYITIQLQPYVGTIASNFTVGQAGNRMKQLLNALIYSGINSIGILNSWDPATLILTYNGSQQSLTVTVSVVFVGQIRFIPVTVTILPLNIVSVSGQVTNPVTI